MVNHAVDGIVAARIYGERKSTLVFGMGVPELAIILAVALLIFGPKNLPKIGSAIGKTVKNVRIGFEDELRDTDGAPGGGSVDVVPTSDEKHCPACGAFNPSQSTYCSKCGVKL